MRHDRDVPSTMRLVIALSAAVVGSACIHDWDSLEAPEDGAGAGTTTGSGGNDPASVETLCATYCDVVASCLTDDPSCSATCQSEMAVCAPGERQTLQICINALNLSAFGCIDFCEPDGAWEGFAGCVDGVSTCWAPPHGCP